MSREKPIVSYKPTENDHVEVGRGAIIFNVLNHPSDLVSNTPGMMVHTSEVISKNEHGFETNNTIYMKEA